MTNRVPRLLGLALALFLPVLSHASDDDADIEQARDATTELIAYTKVLFDCELVIETIKQFPSEHSEMELYFVTLTAEGIECEQVFDVLNHRGRNQGLYFPFPKDDDDPPEDPRRTNFDLIHEIDPEVEQ